MVAADLRALRIALGLSQAAAAALAGMSYNWVRLMEGGGSVSDASRDKYEAALLKEQADRTKGAK